VVRNAQKISEDEDLVLPDGTADVTAEASKKLRAFMALLRMNS
jgi:hypothetical protein